MKLRVLYFLVLFNLYSIANSFGQAGKEYLSEKSSKISFTEHLIFLGKIFLSVFPFIFGLMLVSFVFQVISFFLLKKAPASLAIYHFLLMLIYLCIYGFLGAYFYEVYYFWAPSLHYSWIAYLLCLFAIGTIYKYTTAEAETAKIKFKSEMTLNNQYNPKDFSLEQLDSINTAVFFGGSWMTILSFVIFSFFPDLIGLFFKDYPSYFATLWI